MYGGFETSYFSDIYPDLETFEADFELFKDSLAFYGDFKAPSMVSKIYFMLASEYAYSHHIGARDQWKAMLWARIFEYGPYLEKDLEMQKEVLKLDINDLREGTKAIYNSALNPGTYPSTNSLQELDYINQQNTTNYKKSKAEAILVLKEIMNKNLIKEFLGRFKNLFIGICYPNYSRYYINDPTLTEIKEN